MVYSEKIYGKHFDTENQSAFKQEALNIDAFLYEKCNFQNFECDNIRDADYKQCNFNNLHFYSTLFNITAFIQCTFRNCTFAGVTFADCKFIMCDFKDCKFIKDNLGGNCCFEGSISSKCSVDQRSSVGFDIKVDDDHLAKKNKQSDHSCQIQRF